MSTTEIISLLHGFLGTIFLMSFTGAIVSLLTFKQNRFNLLKYSLILMTLAILFIDITGIYVYGIYRSSDPASAKSKILASETPWVHTILMEFKEFAGVFVALLMLFITSFTLHYKSKVLQEKKLRNSVLILLILAMLLTLLTFGLGAYITKVQPV